MAMTKPMPFDGLHEECGVFGVYGCEDGETAYHIYRGLFALQHRGRKAAVSRSTTGASSPAIKDMGLVNECSPRRF